MVIIETFQRGCSPRCRPDHGIRGAVITRRHPKTFTESDIGAGEIWRMLVAYCQRAMPKSANKR